MKRPLAALLLAAALPALAADAPSDAQIAHIVVTANQVDVDAGKLAQRQASSADVKAFGKMMVTDHTGVNGQATALAKKLGVTPEDNPTSRSLKEGGEKNVASLEALKGSAFDRAYMDHEVAYHEQVLQAIDQVLAPNARNPELKALIAKVRPAIDAHLQHARTLQARLGK